MRPGFDLPPLMFTAEEVEAIVVGLALIGRTADLTLIRAAKMAGAKIAEVLPADVRAPLASGALAASNWMAVRNSKVDPAIFRQAIRESQVLTISYRDGASRHSIRTIKPLAIIYYIEVAILAGWCEVRRGFRHFRFDRIDACEPTGERFTSQAGSLRRTWKAHRDFS